MPELPEVEEVRRTLEPHLLNIPIADIRLLRADFLTPRRAPIRKLVGHAVIRTLRHGKKLFCIADDAQTLLIHLGMTGRVDCLTPDAPLQPHTHALITLANGTQIRFRDPRRFGGLWYYPTFDEARRREIEPLGADALNLTTDHLAHWPRSRARLKQRLLSQHDVAGLGNIYIDEALWMAQLHPRQRLSRIQPDGIETLVAAIRQVLRDSIASGGTTLRDYRNVANQPGNFAQRLRAYGHAGKPCPRCGGQFRSILIAARTSTFCPACQRLR